jgi:hypothetical protein
MEEILVSQVSTKKLKNLLKKINVKNFKYKCFECT